MCFSNGSPDVFFGRFRARFLGLEDGWGLLASELFLFALIEGIKLSMGNLNLFLISVKASSIKLSMVVKIASKSWQYH